MRNTMLAAVAALALIGLPVALTQAQGRGAAPAVPKLATDKTMFWPAADIEARWKENEALKRNNSRLFDGPTNISANVRIVAGEDPPLVHETTADLWIVTAGTAVARTDGKLVENGGTSTIVNPDVRTVRTGDVLYVPPGVPHHFTDMKGFRAWLIRYDVQGWAGKL
jgi:mannose-6-phosphate isomerase-like protein (cupin superfamily)